MQITEVRVFPMNEDKLKAYVTVTFDDCFVVRDLKVISGNAGLFVAMPSKKRKDGSFKDIAHPLNNDFRASLEKVVLDAYEAESKNGTTSSVNESGEVLSGVDLDEEEIPPLRQSLLATPEVQAKTPDMVNASDYSAPDD